MAPSVRSPEATNTRPHTDSLVRACGIALYLRTPLTPPTSLSLSLVVLTALNDAARVAEAQFGRAFMPWDIKQRRARRKLAGEAHPARARSPLPGAARLGMKLLEPATRQLQVRLDDEMGEWKALSVQFSSGAIESVTVHHGSPGQITTQHSSRFFHAAELGGMGLAWPNGLAATVTFAAGTDMGAVQIDYTSLNTYVVAYEDPAVCKRAGQEGIACPTVVIPAVP